MGWLDDHAAPWLEHEWTWVRTTTRVVGYLVGNQSVAEGFVIPLEISPPDWIARTDDPDLLKYARELVIRSAERASDAVDGLQRKAAGHLQILFFVLPGAVSLTVISVGQSADASAAIGFALMALGNVVLVGAVLLAGLATGLFRSIEPTAKRLEDPPGAWATESSAVQIARAMRREIEIWLRSAELAMLTGSFVAADLHNSRRLAIIGSILLAAGLAISWF